MSRTSAWCLMGVALAASGCAQNAVLEVELSMPANPAGEPPRFAYVQAQSSDTVSFDETWAGRDLLGVPLGSEPTTDAISLVTDDAAVMPRAIGLRVRFCVTEDCTGLGDDRAPEARFRIERGFYQGRFTRLELVIDALPVPGTPTRRDLGRCEVEGCTVGSTSDFCTTSGAHFCEE